MDDGNWSYCVHTLYCSLAQKCFKIDFLNIYTKASVSLFSFFTHIYLHHASIHTVGTQVGGYTILKQKHINTGSGNTQTNRSHDVYLANIQNQL